MNEIVNEDQLKSWLCPPNPSTNHARAVEKRHPHTCLWFFHNSEYTKWKFSKKFFLWVHGGSGCGKTVLSSTVIEQLKQQVAQDGNSTVVYFYFDFNDKGKQSLKSMMRSFVHQLHDCHPYAGNLLQKTLCSVRNQCPTLAHLLDIFSSIQNKPKELYIIIDGLDEIDHAQRLKVCSWVKDTRQLATNTLRILITSRDEQDIENRLLDLDLNLRVTPENTQPDICSFLKDTLKTGSWMDRWSSNPEIQRKVLTALTDQAEGM